MDAERPEEAWLEAAASWIEVKQGADWWQAWRSGVGERHAAAAPDGPPALAMQWAETLPQFEALELIRLARRLPDAAEALDTTADQLAAWEATLVLEHEKLQHWLSGVSDDDGGRATPAPVVGSVDVTDSIATVHLDGGLDALRLEARDSVVQVMVNTRHGRRSLDSVLDDHRRRLRSLRKEGGSDQARRYDAMAAELSSEAADLGTFPAIAAELHGLVAQVHLQRGRAEAMEAAAATALALDPHCGPALLCLGEYHLKRARLSGAPRGFEQAASHYEHAAEHATRLAARRLARFNAVLARDGAGQRGVAAEHLRRLRSELPPDHPQQQRLHEVERGWRVDAT